MKRCFLALVILITTQTLSLYSYEFKKVTVVGGWETSPVIGSLLRGLRALGIPHDFNNWADIGDLVYVNSDTALLVRAMELKRNHKIKRLIAGPNLVVRANDLNGIIARSEIDMYLVNSQWTHRAYLEDMPSLRNRLHIWFAGVNTDDWIPAGHKEASRNVIVYWKTESEDFCHQVESMVRKYNFNPIRIRYGFYQKDEYKHAANEALFAIFISRSESQGIALLETWAMNVPTLVWNPRELAAHGRVYNEVSASPYLSAATGSEWKTFSQLELLLQQIDQLLPTYTPRQWVLENMTDVHAALCMLACIKLLP